MLLVFFVLFVSYLLLFLYSIQLRDNSIVDIFWGVWFIIIILTSYFVSDIRSISQYVVSFLVILWGVRLSSHIAYKKRKHSWEDPRYARWRASWKYFYIRSFFQVYMLQWVLMCIIAIPLFALYFFENYSSHFLLTALWTCISLLWLLYEAKADRELSVFKKHKKSWEILTSWLRKFSRYPQYFWESMFWFGICVIASQVSILVFVWWGMITFLLRYVSGVPLLEKRYEGNKEYAEYSKKTPIFIPNFFL